MFLSVIISSLFFITQTISVEQLSRTIPVSYISNERMSVIDSISPNLSFLDNAVFESIDVQKMLRDLHDTATRHKNINKNKQGAKMNTKSNQQSVNSKEMKKSSEVDDDKKEDTVDLPESTDNDKNEPEGLTESLDAGDGDDADFPEPPPQEDPDATNPSSVVADEAANLDIGEADDSITANKIVTNSTEPTTTVNIDALIKALGNDVEGNELTARYLQASETVRAQISVIQDKATEKIEGTKRLIERYLKKGAQYANMASQWIESASAKIPQARKQASERIAAAQTYAQDLIGKAQKKAEQIANGVQKTVTQGAAISEKALNSAANTVKQVREGFQNGVSAVKNIFGGIFR